MSLDDVSSIYFLFFLITIPIGLVSKIFIIILFGYIFFTSTFSKKFISFKGSSISYFFKRKIFF